MKRLINLLIVRRNAYWLAKRDSPKYRLYIGGVKNKPVRKFNDLGRVIAIPLWKWIFDNFITKEEKICNDKEVVLPKNAENIMAVVFDKWGSFKEGINYKETDVSNKI